MRESMTSTGPAGPYAVFFAAALFFFILRAMNKITSSSAAAAPQAAASKGTLLAGICTAAKAVVPAGAVQRSPRFSWLWRTVFMSLYSAWIVVSNVMPVRSTSSQLPYWPWWLGTGGS